jgi:hypothetical protein
MQQRGWAFPLGIHFEINTGIFIKCIVFLSNTSFNNDPLPGASKTLALICD